MIEELDVVALEIALPQYGLVAGDTGTVLLVHNRGEAFTVEFLTRDGETVAIATVPAAHLRNLRAPKPDHAHRL